MAQNIPMGLLQTAQQQFSQGTAAPTQAGTVGVGGGGSSSMKTLKGMMAMGGAAQKLAQQRNLENQKGLQRLFAEAGVGPQGLLNTLGIGLGNALGQSMRAGSDPAMDAANAEDARAAEFQNTINNIDISTSEGALDMASIQNQLGNTDDTVQFLQLADSIETRNNANAASAASSARTQLALEITNSVDIDPYNPIPGLQKLRYLLRKEGLNEDVARITGDIESARAGQSSEATQAYQAANLKVNQEKENRLRQASQNPQVELTTAQTNESIRLVNEGVKFSDQSISMERLAERFIELNPKGGSFANLKEAFKTVTGTEDAITVLRAQFNDIRTSVSIGNLPPGVASDKDIALVLSGFLEPSANAETIASFLRGLSKLSAIKAERSNFFATELENKGTTRDALKGFNALMKSRAVEPEPEPETSLPEGFSLKEGN